MRTAATAALALALLMAGCATDAPSTDDPVIEGAPDDAGVAADGTGDGDGDREDGEPSTGARETDEQGEVEVDIRMFDFEDDVVEISVGETVTWTNQDATRHTVTSGVDGEPDGAFEVTFSDRGDVASVTFDEPGEYHYFCMPHQFMTATVIVTE